MSTVGNAQCTIPALTRAREILNIRRGETLKCRCTKNLYVVTALALRVRQLRPVFSRKLKLLHFSWFLFSFRVESKAKDDFKFPVMVEDGKHSCTEVCIQPNHVEKNKVREKYKILIVSQFQNTNFLFDDLYQI